LEFQSYSIAHTNNQNNQNNQNNTEFQHYKPKTNNMESITQTFTPEQIAAIRAVIGITKEKLVQLVDADYTSDSESESGSGSGSDSGCEETRVKRRRGRPMKVRTAEELAAREASNTRGRGRPKVERTPEQLVAIANAVAAKESRKKAREAKILEREAAEAMKKKLRDERQAKAAQKAIEKAERSIAAKAKRIEIYQKMCADAEAYKAKWDL